MKKYIYFVIALVIGVFTSCTDKDDIDIILHHDVQLNINVTNMYEVWGISDYQNFLGGNPSLKIGVTSFVYNAEGKLCNEITTTSKTFQDVNQELNGLEDGEYTILTFETFVNSDDDNQSDKWIIENKENYEDVMVTFKPNAGTVTYWYQIFGTACNKITVGKDHIINITPKSKGCMIGLGYENFDKSKFNYFDLAVKNKAHGMYLNPNKSQPYYYDEYLDKNTYGTMAYFWSTDVLPSSDSYYYYSFETGNLSFMFGGSKSMWINDNLSYDAYTNDFTWNLEDGKTYMGYCYYNGQPTWFEHYFGLQKDFSSWYKNLDKSMNPLFAEPCVSWGATVSYVKSFMNGYYLYQDITTNEEDGLTWMGYSGKYSEIDIQYYFEDKKSGLYGVQLYFLEDNATLDDIMEHMENSSYEFIGYNEEENEYRYGDQSTYVGIYPDLESDGIKYSIVEYIDRRYVDEVPTESKARMATKRSKSLPKTNLRSKKFK